VASERKLRKFLRRWRRRYPFPFDWVDDRTNRSCRKSESEWLAQFAGATTLRRREVRAIVEWRFASQPDRMAKAFAAVETPATWGHARRCIKKALADHNATSALDRLLGERDGVPGWDPPVASALLAACRPERFVVADERSLRSLKALGLYPTPITSEFLRDDWWLYLSRCRQLARDVGMSLRAVEQALWAAADHAPELPKNPKRRRPDHS